EEITTRDHLYTAFGFPISRVIPSDTKTHFTYQPVTCTGWGRPSAIKHLKLSPDNHIAIEFERTNSFIRGGGFETAPRPQGMSGGGGGFLGEGRRAGASRGRGGPPGGAGGEGAIR